MPDVKPSLTAVLKRLKLSGMIPTAYFGPSGRGVSVEVGGPFRSKWNGHFGDVALPFRHMWHTPELNGRTDAG